MERNVITSKIEHIIEELQLKLMTRMESLRRSCRPHCLRNSELTKYIINMVGEKEVEKTRTHNKYKRIVEYIMEI